MAKAREYSCYPRQDFCRDCKCSSALRWAGTAKKRKKEVNAGEIHPVLNGLLLLKSYHIFHLWFFFFFITLRQVDNVRRFPWHLVCSFPALVLVFSSEPSCLLPAPWHSCSGNSEFIIASFRFFYSHVTSVHSRIFIPRAWIFFHQSFRALFSHPLLKE